MHGELFLGFMEMPAGTFGFAINVEELLPEMLPVLPVDVVCPAYIDFPLRLPLLLIGGPAGAVSWVDLSIVGVTALWYCILDGSILNYNTQLK